MTTDISFSCDGLVLKGTLHLPAADKPPFVIGCHGLSADRSSPKQVALARRCRQLGIAYLRIDHRGCGESEGVFEKVTTLAARCRDLAAALEWMRTGPNLDGRFGLFGSSLGGAVCLAAAAELKPAAVVTVAAPIRNQAGGGGLQMPPSTSPETAFFLSDERRFDISDRLGQVSNTLLFHGADDEVVPIAHAQEILGRLQDPKRLLVREKGDHRMSDPVDQAEFIELATEWFCRALQPR